MTETTRDVIVVGGGASGLAAAHRLVADKPGLDVICLEPEDRPGGTATTDTVDGYVVDRGPNGVLSNVPYTLDLAGELGIDAIAAASDAKKRYIYRRGRLRAVPSSLLSFSMLGPIGVARAAVEPLVATPPPDGDESVHAFFQRRFGLRTADLLAGAMVSGITAGDAARTSVRSLFPKVANAEAKHGSVIRGMRRERDPDQPRSTLMSFPGGMGALSDTLGSALGDRLRLGATATSVGNDGEAWVVQTATGGALRARAVVLATPAPVTARLVGDVAPQLAEGASTIPYAGIRVVSLGFDASAFPGPLKGFGFLVPRGEGVRMLGSVWTSCVFPDRAPEGKVLLRVMIGGVHEPDAIGWSDGEAEEIVLGELAATMGLSGSPEMSHHTVWKVAIPQYELGHAARLARVREAEAAHPGLRLCGNAWEGISLNESVRAANEAAADVISFLDQAG